MSTRKNPTLEELFGLVRRVPLVSRRLDDEHDEEDKIYGYCEFGRRITINEAACVVDCLIHELVHEARPSWAEATVHRRADALFKKLSNDDIHRLFRSYRRRVRRETHKLLL